MSDSASPPKSGLFIALNGGERAWLVSHETKRTTIYCSTSSPPGSTVVGRVEGVSASFQLKVRNCQKVGDLFLIEGRTQNATRELSAALRRAVLQGKETP